jgi:hypothetical protein
MWLTLQMFCVDLLSFYIGPQGGGHGYLTAITFACIYLFTRSELLSCTVGNRECS